MNKYILPGIVLSAMLFINGCGGGPTLDASNEDTFKKSVEDVSKGLDPDKKDKFEKALQTLMMKKVLFAAGDEETMKKNMKETFNGKNADQIIAAGEAAKADVEVEIKKMMGK